jgi:hypothetical protein
MNKKNNKTEEKTNQRKNWLDPNVSLTYEEFIEGIREAEKGPFYTVEEAMEKKLKSKAPRRGRSLVAA